MRFARSALSRPSASMRLMSVSLKLSMYSMVKTLGVENS